MPRRIFVMGGGGFSMEPDHPVLDDYLLGLTGVARPRVCFVPTASGDAQGYVDRFLDAFGDGRAEPTVLRLFERTHDDLRALLRSQDVVYVGGGNTASLLGTWRAHGLPPLLAEAADGGTVLAGISAGMNCWFEASVTDSFGSRLEPLHDGLGLLPGSSCPHYDGEEHRASTYRRLVAGGFPAGYAADDGCGLLFEDGRLVDAVASRAGADGYRVELTAAGVVERPLGARLLGAAPEPDAHEHVRTDRPASGYSEPPISSDTLS